jgi:hypothetical protein
MGVAPAAPFLYAYRKATDGAGMPAQTIENAATIGDVAKTLNKPEEYVRHVLSHLHECRKLFGKASVRIGVLGKGRAPNYRIEYPKSPGIASVFAVYRGSSHIQMDDFGEQPEIDLLANDFPSNAGESRPDHILMNEHWSSRTTDLSEVATVFGKLRERRR